MSLNDPLANVLSHIQIEDKKGKKQIIAKTSSKIIKAVLKLMHENNYLGDINDIEGTKISINLIGSVNKTNVIKPRYSVKSDEYEKFVKRYLPAFGFGFLIVSTNKGMMTHEEAMKLGIGGKLVAYVY